MNNFFLSSDLDWIILALMVILMIVMFTPFGEKVVDFCAPRDDRQRKIQLTGEKRKQYKLIICGFAGILAVDEILMLAFRDVMIVQIIYVLIAAGAIVFYAVMTRRLTR